MASAGSFDAVAWSWRGPLSLMEREALCALAGLHVSVAKKPWGELSAAEANQIILAFRRAIELGHACAGALLDEAESQRQALGRPS